MQYDVIIVGGSYAGLAAGMPLARARRRVLVVDGGQRRNRFARHSHGFLTQDGTEAAAIVAKGREQLLAYQTVEWLDGQASGVERTPAGFRVRIDGAEPREAKRLILATGVADRLPDLPGLAGRWGSRVFHCPYCHGYELKQGRVGVLATSPLSMHLALMLPDWGSTTLFLNDAFEPGGEQLEALRARGVKLESGSIDRIEGELDLVMRDGRIVRLDGLFVATRAEAASPIAASLGCEFEEGPLGRIVKTDPVKATSVSGVYACGDTARLAGNVPWAVADGTMAGVAAHQSLMFGGH